MLADRDITDLSFSELGKLWKRLKKLDCILNGGWAAHILINDAFRKERKIDYIGSKYIDFAVSNADLLKAFGIVEDAGFFPLSFRYCKIYSKSLEKFVTEKKAAGHPVHDLFYLFVDFITDKKPDVKFTVFEDETVKFMMENRLFLEINGIRVVTPELLVLSKLRILKERGEDKRAKDILDSILVSAFYEDFDANVFREFSERLGFDKGFARKEARKSNDYLEMVGFSDAEASNIIVSFESLIL